MKNVIISIVGILSIAAISISLYVLNTIPKIGYVHSQELIYGFSGMKHVQSELGTKKNMWQSNIDTLNFELQRAFSSYESDKPNLGSKEIIDRERALRIQQDNVRKYAQSIEDKVEKEENELVEGVLNQVNSISIEYGEIHGYDIIFGTTNSGNIVHGIEEHNITQELLTYLNQRYAGNFE